MNPKFVEREIIRQLRTRLREYFPSLQSFIDQKIITKYDWIFFGIVYRRYWKDKNLEVDIFHEILYLDNLSCTHYSIKI